MTDVSVSSPTNAPLPSGEDLIKLLGYAYANRPYVLYGTQIDRILCVETTEGMDVPEPNTLVWVGGSAPTLAELAAKWQKYQSVQAQQVSRNPEGFEGAIYNDPDLRQTLMRANPIVFAVLLRLLAAKPENFTVESIVETLGELRQTMSPDFSPEQLQRINNYAQQNGLPEVRLS